MYEKIISYELIFYIYALYTYSNYRLSKKIKPSKSAFLFATRYHVTKQPGLPPNLQGMSLEKGCE